MKKLKLFDLVANLNAIAIERLMVKPGTSIKNLPSGQVGRIIEVYEQKEECRYLVEFADIQGCEYIMATLRADELIVLHLDLIIA